MMKKKVLVSLALLTMFAVIVAPAVFADDPAIPEEATSMINSIVNLLQWMFTLVGGGLILFGGFTALMGWYQERPDDAARGFRTLAVGAGIFALGLIVNQFFAL